MSAGEWVIAGEPTGTLPTVGGLYEVRHSRKGKFTGVCLGLDGCWMDVEIRSGTAKAILRENVRESGEIIRIRDVHSYLIPLVHAVAPADAESLRTKGQP
jgi:hypothetical protein